MSATDNINKHGPSRPQSNGEKPLVGVPVTRALICTVEVGSHRVRQDGESSSTVQAGRGPSG